MSFRNFIKLLHIHPILILFIIVSILTGTFLQLFILLLFVTIHEWGHFVAARFFGWKIEAIILWVFGGVMQTEEHLNRPVKEEMIVTICGPLQHLFIFICLFVIDYFSLVSSSVIQIAYEYNLIILLFNLLPIYPLDGGKMLLHLFYRFFPFIISHRYIIIFSLSLCFLIIGITFVYHLIPMTILFVIMFLALENFREWKKIPYLFFRFLYQRFTGDTSYENVKYIAVHRNERLYDILKRFFRIYSNYVYIFPVHIINERALLHYYFHEKNYEARIDQLLEK